MLPLESLPALNAMLNGAATICLSFGYYCIRKKNQAVHQRWMIAALVLSALFLTSYLIYHFNVGSMPYPFHDWTRPVYFTILIPHIILAAVMTPFIVVMVYHALRGQFAKHRKLARWVWPVWMFVSVTGVMVYLMLYRPGM